MSIKQFKFVSPGVFINEIDNSALPETSDAIGPTVIGRTERGPALRPVRVQSYSEFVNIFGNAIPGGDGKDVWRNGNYTSPTYAAYAAQAYLRNGSPVTVVRLLGDENPEATDAGKAGWKTANATYPSPTSHPQGNGGGAYGLFIFPSGSTSQWGTGTLGAVWYMETGYPRLTGTIAGGFSSQTTASVGVFVQSDLTDFGFKAEIMNTSSVAGETVLYTTEFNFNEASDKFVRKVFNTNPTLTNSSVGSAALTSSYFLGESYENWLGNANAGHNVTDSTATHYGIILPLQEKNNSGANDRSKHQKKLRAGQTDFVFSQDLSNDAGTYAVNIERTPNLFRFVTLNAALWESQNFKISIEDIRESTTDADPYGTFTVVVRDARDTDNAVRYIERYPQCNLNPQSENYIARKIGDAYSEWDYSEGRYINYGRFANQSKYIRVVMDENVDAGLTDERRLPAGFRGPTKLQDVFIIGDFANHTGSEQGVVSTAIVRHHSQELTGSGDETTVPIKKGADSLLGLNNFISGALSDASEASSSFYIAAQIAFPGHLARKTSTNGPSAQKSYYGYYTGKSDSTAEFAPWHYDAARALSDGLYDTQFNDSTTTFSTGSAIKRSFIFTLDDLSASSDNTVDGSPSLMNWVEGSRAAGNSYRGSASFGAMLKKGFDRFTIPIYGGNDGLNVKEMEPFRNSAIDAAASNTTNYAVQTIQRAVAAVADPEVVDTNMITMPGLTHQGLITRIIRTCEERADALAVVDLKGGYQPNTEAVGSEQDRRGSIDSVTSNLQALQENSSYACAYYPWVQIRDPEKGALVWVPPSVAALGVFANTEATDELWFAPAGFRRGGLSQGAAGLPVVGTSQRLTSKERDNLYEANINPIANFPNEGIVVFGQKTLQVTPSALDRINVRRLMNFVKKEISRMANGILFQPNVEETWINFTSRVEPFLASVKARLGLDDFKVVLDNTTTTPELIDRNIVYAKIFLKPTKAIEYIAIDFNITNSGASFED